jgi:hypothetical protein
MSGGTFNAGGTFTFGSAGLAMTLSGGTMKLGNLVSSAPSVLTISGSGVLLVKNANYSTNQANTHLTAGRIVKAPEMIVGTATVDGTLYTRIGLPPPARGTVVVVQ